MKTRYRKSYMKVTSAKPGYHTFPGPQQPDVTAVRESTVRTGDCHWYASCMDIGIKCLVACKRLLSSKDYTFCCSLPWPRA